MHWSLRYQARLTDPRYEELILPDVTENTIACKDNVWDIVRVQFRSDRGWQLIASDLISSRSTWVLILSLTFFGRLRVRFGHRCSCELRRACQPRRLLQRLRAENAV